MNQLFFLNATEVDTDGEKLILPTYLKSIVTTHRDEENNEMMSPGTQQQTMFLSIQAQVIGNNYWLLNK